MSTVQLTLVFQRFNEPRPRSILFVLGAIAVHISVMHVGPTQVLLNLEPIGLETWLRILTVAPSVLVVAELHKRFRGGVVGS